MQIIKSILAFIAMVWGGLSGGQGKQAGKAPRRFFAPLAALGFGASIKWRLKYLAFLLWIPIFSAGYGVDSQLGAVCFHIEWLIRLVYALLVALPFFVFGVWKALISSVLLVIAFQVQAGSIGYTEGFGDWLIEDIFRYVTWAICVIATILTDKD